MTATIHIPAIWRLIKAIMNICFAAFLLCVLVFCFFYLFSSHDYLARWYYGLNSCFFESDTWDTIIFTKNVKSNGNTYCIIAILITLMALLYMVRERKKNNSTANDAIIRLEIPDLLLVFSGIIIGFFFWILGSYMARPSYDEVFSAQYVADIHPFQGLSYYMLPNNHLLFNLLNNLFFRHTGSTVFTGRILSLIAYCSFITASFFWFKKLINNRWLAFLTSIVLAAQFQVWGFSFQARGYELYLLCEWGAVISLFSYLRHNDSRWLALQVLCIAGGYLCMPSFLYMHAALLLFMVLYQLVYRKWETAFYKYQLFAIALSFLFYLPTLCFSGIKLITSNNYVASMDSYKTTGAFCSWLFPSFLPYLGHLFSDAQPSHYPWYLLLFILPLGLLLNRKNKTHFSLGLFYISMWCAFFVIVIAMRRPPFERNLIGHYSITLGSILLMIYWLAGLPWKMKTRMPQLILYTAVLVLFLVHFIKGNQELIKDTLYEYNVNDTYTVIDKGLSDIPPGSSVGFSKLAFYCYFVCREHGCKVSKCDTGTEAYFVRHTSDEPPAGDKYTLIKSFDAYELYKKN